MEQVLKPMVSSKAKMIPRIIAGVVILSGVYAIFIYKDENDKTYYGKLAEFIKNKGMTRDKAIEVINAAFDKPMKDASAYDTDYLIARAKAIKSNSATFTAGEKTYNTKTGKAV